MDIEAQVRLYCNVSSKGSTQFQAIQKMIVVLLMKEEEALSFAELFLPENNNDNIQMPVILSAFLSNFK